MILIYMLACRSVGGSEGFVIADAILFHVRDSEYVEVEGSFEKEHSGNSYLWATGGGKCPFFPKEERPDGEGWEKSTDEKYTDEERCAWFSSGVGGKIYSGMWRQNMNLTIRDGMYAAEEMTAEVTECVQTTRADILYDWETVDIELDSADLKIHGDMGHITAKAGSKLVVDLTLPLCLVDYAP
jgi:hypothetical protein